MWGILGLLLPGCGKDSTIDTVDTDLCTGAPVLTYANFGQGFMLQNCQPCHASTSPNRYGAPAEVTFDDEAQVWALADRILARAAGASPTMPPEGGIDEENRAQLEIWLTCGGE